MLVSLTRFFLYPGNHREMCTATCSSTEHLLNTYEVSADLLGPEG